ncbi:hypothetical protein B0H15DRAFT_841083 [Mycena belliarum]|uniref:Protein kinase domain-containing protein n=1 Tax=Mycena belliarum TaxID=1033014 RepID=A0AAD6U5Y6_9AGAR|nr:hypothetical protein B0H15DRAFT_841083 [Mycena belliae]
MDSEAIDTLYREIFLLFDYNPPPVAQDPSLNFRPDLKHELTTFYDKHLDEKLGLKCVRTMPSLPNDIASTVITALKDVKEKGIYLPPLRNGGEFTVARARAVETRLVRAAEDVATFYRTTTSSYCQPVASMLALHQRAPCWAAVVTWRRGLECKPPLRFPGLEEEYALRIPVGAPGKDPRIYPALWAALDDATRKLVLDVMARFTGLAVWQVFMPSEEADELIDDMGTVAELESFRPYLCGTLGFESSPSRVMSPPDSGSTPWTLPAPAMASQPPISDPYPQIHPSRRSLRLSAINKTNVSTSPAGRKKTASPSKTPVEGSITIPNRHAVSPSSLTDRYMQHAWTRAAALDSTFIIFYNGNSERIGFRHRATQTLYLSEYLEPRDCDDPCYGRLHTGLYISILLDLVDRMEQHKKTESETRPAPSGDSDSFRAAGEPPEKRQKLDLPAGESSPKLGIVEIGVRNIALLVFRYGIFNSQRPAAFIRCAPSLTMDNPGPNRRCRAKKHYRRHEYIVITLTSEIERGATGIVHGGTLTISDIDGIELTVRIVVKFAFSAKQKEKMRHEFSIYRHLSAAHVQGVVDVFGLFEDVEQGPLAMVMSYAGVSIRSRPSKNLDVTVTDEERAAFLQVLDGIHAANVRHHDIRPENMLVDEAGRATIIDFDIAELYPSRSSRKREREHMVGLLNDAYVPPRTFRSAASSSDPESDLGLDSGEETA